MAIACDLTISFGSAGNSLAYLGGGWARSEREFSWAIGAESHLVVPRPEPADEYFLTLDVVPFIHPPELPGQRLIVSINDTAIGATELARPTLLGYRIGPGLARGSDRMLITLEHPDAARPKDFCDTGDERRLAFSLSEAKLYRATDADCRTGARLPAGLTLGAAGERGAFDASRHAGLKEWAIARTGLPVADLALQFESLGENCEFGLFQRRCEAEPLGLLRFSSTFMRNLIRGIDNGFAGLGEVEDIDPRLEGDAAKEYMIHEAKYSLVYHTFVYEGQRSVWLMREQEAARLKFLRRKFMEELEAHDKIFVYKFSATVSEEQILPLHMALNRYGDATLLWIVEADRDHPPGAVEVVVPGLLKGFIDRFAPDDDAHDLSFDGWLKVCANAYVLSRLERSLRAADRPDPASVPGQPALAAANTGTA